MQSKIFCVAYRNDGSGPSRGANALSKGDENIEVVYLFNKGRYLRLSTIWKICRAKRVALIGFGLIPDLIILLFGGKNKKISYLRGDITENYLIDFKYFHRIAINAHLHIINRLDHVLYLTVANYDKLHSRIHTRSNILPNVVSVEEFRLSAEVRESRKSSIVVIGGLHERKRSLDAVHIVNQLIKSTGQPITLQFFGDGPLKDKIIKTANELNVQCVMHGFVPDPYSLIIKDDILLHCAVSEGASRTILEALALALYTVSSNWPGVTEIISHEITGFIYSNRDEAVRSLSDIISNRAFVSPQPLSHSSTFSVQQKLKEIITIC